MKDKVIDRVINQGVDHAVSSKWKNGMDAVSFKNLMNEGSIGQNVLRQQEGQLADYLYKGQDPAHMIQNLPKQNTSWWGVFKRGLNTVDDALGDVREPQKSVLRSGSLWDESGLAPLMYLFSGLCGSQVRMQKALQEVAEAKEGGLSVGEMILLQHKVHEAGQTVDFVTICLSKLVDTIKVVHNVQI